MPLINCPICQNEISDKAKRCPHCNSVLKKSKAKFIVIPIVSVILVAALAYGAAVGIPYYMRYKSIKEYNDTVSETVVIFHKTLEDTLEKVNNDDYTHASDLVNTLRTEIRRFDDLPINEESEIGMYIKSMRENPVYTTFKEIYIDTTRTDLDYNYILSKANANLIGFSMEQLLQTELPDIKQ